VRSAWSGFAPEVTAQFSLTGWGWHHEAGTHVLRLILSGTFEKYPGLQGHQRALGRNGPPLPAPPRGRPADRNHGGLLAQSGRVARQFDTQGKDDVVDTARDLHAADHGISGSLVHKARATLTVR
jgi:hypothetical protein